MSVTTAMDIINSALRVLQVKASDVVLTASEANDALDCFNTMIDSWSTESLMLYHITKETFNITAGVNPYTFGTGGSFNSNRPVEIEQATVSVGGTDQPIKIVAYDDYAAILLKSLTAGYPQELYVDADYPLSTLYFYPAPNINTTVTLYSRKALTQFANLTSTFLLPPGYARALKYCLACEIAPEYQTTAGADVLKLAAAAKSNIKRVNKRVMTMQIDPMLVSGRAIRFNIYSGQ